MTTSITTPVVNIDFFGPDVMRIESKSKDSKNGLTHLELGVGYYFYSKTPQTFYKVFSKDGNVQTMEVTWRPKEKYDRVKPTGKKICFPSGRFCAPEVTSKNSIAAEFVNTTYNLNVLAFFYTREKDVDQLAFGSLQLWFADITPYPTFKYDDGYLVPKGDVKIIDIRAK